MNRKEIHLSIAVPTFNRASYLESLIRVVVSEIQKYHLQDSIELFILDNNSTDKTEETVERYLASGIIRYHKNETNIGMTRNIIKCIEESKGYYTFVFGDDDLLVEDALPKILSLLKEYPKSPVAIFKSLQTNYVTVKEPVVISIKSAARNYFYYIGNVGIFLLQTRFAQPVIERYRSRIESSCWPQTEIMFLAMHESKEQHPLLISPVESASSPQYEEIRVYNSWYLIETTHFALLRVAINLSEQLSPEFIEHATKGTPNISRFYNFFRTIVIYSTYFDFDDELDNSRQLCYKGFKEFRGKYKFQALILLIIVYSPRFLKKAMMDLVKIVSNPFSFNKKIADHKEHIRKFMDMKTRVYKAKGKIIDLKGGIS